MYSAQLLVSMCMYAWFTSVYIRSSCLLVNRINELCCVELLVRYTQYGCKVSAHIEKDQ